MKEKQIEEMEKVIIKTRNILKNILLVGSRPVKNTSKKDCYSCLMNLQELYKTNSIISDKDFLKILFEAKLSEDSVIISKERFEALETIEKYHIKSCGKDSVVLSREEQEQMNNELRDKIYQACKLEKQKTAEKIINHFVKEFPILKTRVVARELAKQFGIEIKE